MAKTSAARTRTSKKKPAPARKAASPARSTALAIPRNRLTKTGTKARRVKTTTSKPGAAATEPYGTLADVTHARTLFWQDCVRQMLTGLAMIQTKSPELFDGRTAILTHGGERIPIAELAPLFACGIPTSDQTKAASIAVECTVFRVRTPSGELFTLPVHEIRALHSLTPELIKELEQAALAQSSHDTPTAPGPFGFAAYAPRPAAPAAVDAAI